MPQSEVLGARLYSDVAELSQGNSQSMMLDVTLEN